jgi:hypothetical protein
MPARRPTSMRHASGAVDRALLLVGAPEVGVGLEVGLSLVTLVGGGDAPGSAGREFPGSGAARGPRDAGC